MGVSGGGPYVAVCAYKTPQRIIKAGIIAGLSLVTVKGNLNGMTFQGKIGWVNYQRFPLLRILASLGAAIEFCYFPFLGSLIGFPSLEDRIIFNQYKKITGEESSIKEAFRQGIKGPALELKIYTSNWGFKVKDIKTKIYLWYGAKDRCVSLNMGKYYHNQISGSKLFIDPQGVHLSRYFYEEKILKALTA